MIFRRSQVKRGSQGLERDGCYREFRRRDATQKSLEFLREDAGGLSDTLNERDTKTTIEKSFRSLPASAGLAAAGDVSRVSPLRRLRDSHMYISRRRKHDFANTGFCGKTTGRNSR